MALRAVLLSVLILGACAFVLDVLSPLTPTPIVQAPAEVFVLVLLAIVRLLFSLIIEPVFIGFGNTPPPFTNSSASKLIPNILGLTCVQLR